MMAASGRSLRSPINLHMGHQMSLSDNSQTYDPIAVGGGTSPFRKRQSFAHVPSSYDSCAAGPSGQLALTTAVHPPSTQRELLLQNEASRLRLLLEARASPSDAESPAASPPSCPLHGLGQEHAARGGVGDMEHVVLAAAVAAKASSARMRRPAAAIPAVCCKRPAAFDMPIDVNMDDVFGDLKKQRTTLSRSAFTSRAYDSAKRRAVLSGVDKLAASTFVEANYEKACELCGELS
jgi:hypothetical protein